MIESVKQPPASKNKASQLKSKLSNSQKIGIYGEDRACAWLVNHGYQVIDRNFRTRVGEIDVVAWDSTRHELVFVEVKYRRGDLAAEAVTPWKRYKVMKTIHFYVAHQGYEGAYRWCVLAIQAGKIHWIDEVL